MKKNILSLVAIAMVTMASAQTEKGKWVVGTQIPLTTPALSLNMTDGATTFGISANAGYFFADKMSINAGIGYTLSKFTDIDAIHGVDFTVGARYYIASKFPIGVNYKISKMSGINATGSLKFSAGYAAFVSKNVAIEPAIYYALPFSANSQSAFGLVVGFGYYF